jgi:Mg2+ and Co2+ transporter CorA
MPISAMQVHLTPVTVRQNEGVKRLAGWGAILAVPSMVFSLYGLDFNSIPELGVRMQQSRHAGRRDRKLCDSVPEA